ncbi:MAG: hypothetical protein HOY79_33610 [Streptomyces sp.]|nr:hypothetical protein [Streptomyces sp.]NUS11370.1 hypothetical protein [Streptomyces sp.]NUS23489.1 hypothetical protein [Streptomyces sp.]
MQNTTQQPRRCPVRTVHCPRIAGFGTDHPGAGLCRQHELEAAAAARAERRGTIPQAVFQEAQYVDGLPYAETAPLAPPIDDGETDGAWGWIADLQGDDVVRLLPA